MPLFKSHTHDAVEEGMRIEINDLYLGAFLLCRGIGLEAVVYHRTNRATLVMAGANIAALREEYQSGPVSVNLKELKKSYNKIRNRIRYAYPTERSFSCHRNVLSEAR